MLFPIIFYGLSRHSEFGEEHGLRGHDASCLIPMGVFGRTTISTHNALSPFSRGIYEAVYKEYTPADILRIVDVLYEARER